MSYHQCTLPNKVQLIYYHDASIKEMYAEIIINCGGINNEYTIDGKKKRVSDGVAHFLEHILIEHSIYGNAYQNFNDDSVRFNGGTSLLTTSFYIDTVHDFTDNLTKLIRIVNTPMFTQEDIDNAKGPIIDEIRKNKDDKARTLNIITRECVYHTFQTKSNTGEEDYISQMDYPTLKDYYDAFYRLDNQTIAISGNISFKKIKEIIIEIYDSIHKEKREVILPKCEEPREVVRREWCYEDIKVSDFIRIVFKIPLHEIVPKERVKLSFYINCFVRNLFSETSAAYTKLLKRHISVYNIGSSIDYFDDYLILCLECDTSKHEAFQKLIFDTLNKWYISEEDFALWKKKNLLNMMMREDDASECLECFLENIMTFNYLKPDTIQDIEDLTYEDFLAFMKKLDFSNYAIIKRLKKEQ